MGKVMQVASFSLAEVTYITGDIGYQVQESVKNAQFRVRAKQENVSGVMLPAFESYQEGTNGMLVFALCLARKRRRLPMGASIKLSVAIGISDIISSLPLRSKEE